MKLYVHQSIIINNIKIDNLTTSAVFQIGSAGSIKTLSKFSNTGGFTQPTPPLTAPGQIISISPPPPSSS
ncbi:spore germination protein GerPB [Bacillus sp. CGMCC 1.60114]|uniref:spore germination protein GerPB n=1 Tax=unclassified Bacillus (in: firmicutes) TaxID=185979 RepID=UPI00362EE7B0